MSIGRSARRSKSDCDAGSNFTTRSNAVPRSKIRPTVVPGEARLDGLGDVVGPQAVPGDRRAIQHEPDERHVHLLLERQVDDARHAGHDVPHVLAEAPQRREIVAEDLHGDVRARAREHVIDAVRDRLTDRHVRARQRREAAAQLREQLRARPPGLPQAHVDLRRLDALHVLVVLGAAGAARRGHDLRLRQQDLLDATPDLVGLRQRRAGQRVGLNRQGAFVELRQKRACPSASSPAAAMTSSTADDGHHETGMIERAGQILREARLERARQPAVVPASGSSVRPAERRSRAPA